MLKNFSLTAKLSLVPAVALFGLVLYVLYTSLQLSATDSRLALLETRSYPTLEKTDAVIFQFSRVPALLNNAVAAGEPGVLDEARQVLQQIDSQQQSLATLLADQRTQQQALEEWRKAVRGYADNALAASSKLIDGSASFDDLRPSLDRMASELAQAQQLGSTFRAQAYGDFQQTLAQTRETNAATTRLGIVISLVLVVLVGLGAWLVIRSVMANVRGVIASLQSIARGDGDLSQRVNVESNDEIGAMIELFNGFLDKLQGTIRQIIEAANPLGQVSKELYQLTQGAEENAKSQQHHTDSITRDILTMTGSIQEVAQRSRQASDQANAAARQTASAREHVSSLSTGISDLGDSVMGAVKAMEQLEEETQEVGSVLTVIRSIAEQTNLLALNAAIEAARAGEQGRGFAVVASEVRALAQRSAGAAKEIKGLIDTSVASTAKGNEQASRAGATMQDIVDSINRVTDIMGEISAASREQTTGIEEINAAVTQMDDVTRQNASLVEESAAAAASLQEQADTLVDLVAFFHLDEADHPDSRRQANAPRALHAQASRPPRLLAARS